MSSWIDEELAVCEFTDARLGKRFELSMKQLSKDVGLTPS